METKKSNTIFKKNYKTIKCIIIIYENPELLEVE